MSKARELLERLWRKVPLSGRDRTQTVPVYMNPSRQELLYVAGGYRGRIQFIADSRIHRVFIWGGDENQKYMVNALRYYLYDPRLLIGTVAYQRGHWVMVRSNVLSKKPSFLKAVLRQNWTWVDAFFNVSEYLTMVTDDPSSRAQSALAREKRRFWGL